MTSRFKWIAGTAACLACCMPILLTIAGVTTGAAGAAGLWFGRNQALIVVAAGLAYLGVTVLRHLRPSARQGEKLETLTRKPE